MRLLLLLMILPLAFGAQAAQDRFANVEITTVKVAGNVSLLYGSGGNIGVSAGPDGILMIDDQFLPLSDRIKAALAELGTDSPTWLLNTHYHGDHTGGNPAFGDSSIIVAHDNVRLRLLAGQPPMAAEGLPVVTYSDRASIHFNGEEVRLIHLPTGHTDGDSVVLFTESGVIHLGDHFFRDRFPYVDLNGGGTVDGYIRNVEMMLTMIDDDMHIIPGHGELARRDDLVRFLDMMKATRAKVQQMLDAGNSAEDIVARGLGDQWSSWNWAFINEERWIRTLVSDLQ